MATAEHVVEPPAGPAGLGDFSFPIGGPTRTSWREHALTSVSEQRFLALWFRGHDSGHDPRLTDQAVTVVNRHLDAAQKAAEGAHDRWWTRTAARYTGADVERAMTHLDAAMATLLRLAPRTYVDGQLPSIVTMARNHLAIDDPRRVRVERLYERPRETPLADREREELIAAFHASRSAARREIMRVRSFRNLVVITTVLLSLAVSAIVALGVMRPDVIALCFNPGEAVVCPTHQASLDEGAGAGAGSGVNAAPGEQGAGEASAAAVDRVVRATASSWDVPLVALVGLLAAALASAATIRGVQGTSTPYSLPVELGVLKLPTGALTALLGVLLMRGQFVPGLSALDTPEQIVAWAILFGYSQQILTRFVDQRGQSVLSNVRAGGGPPVPPRPEPKPA